MSLNVKPSPLQISQRKHKRHTVDKPETEAGCTMPMRWVLGKDTDTAELVYSMGQFSRKAIM